MTDSAVPADLRYTTTHEWVAITGDIWTIGLTDHAQAELTDIVFCEVIAEGRVAPGTPIAEVESIKSTSEIYAPVAGEILGGNPKVIAAPETINSDPYGEGWILRIKVTPGTDASGLLDAEGYRAKIG